MKVVIAGSRGLTDPRLVAAAVQASGFDVTSVLSGCARGVDRLGEIWAAEQGILVERFPADWDRHPRTGGIVRNWAMVRRAAAAPEGGAVLAIWDGVSNGTRHTIYAADQLGLPVHIFLAPRKQYLPQFVPNRREPS